MAAGLGFKDFTTGEVLTAADVDGYLMQGVWVFASAAARDAAVTSPQEGNFAYLKDTNVTTYYTGSAWANLDTTGMTNPMTTTGDTIYSSSGSTPARLGIGSTGQVLTVAGGVPTWSAPGGGKIVQVINTAYSTATSGTTSYVDSGITATITPTSASNKILVMTTVSLQSSRSSSTNTPVNVQLRRGSTTIANYDTRQWNYIDGMPNGTPTLSLVTTLTYMDSPATTSATTYLIRGQGPETTSAFTFQPNSGPSAMILMEIGA